MMIFMLQETELLVAGIPCIDVSSAGHRKGAAGLVRPPLRNCTLSWAKLVYSELSSKVATD